MRWREGGRWGRRGEIVRGRDCGCVTVSPPKRVKEGY